MATVTSNNVGDMFRQGLETFEATMKAAARIQEESARRFTDMMQEMGSPAQWQRRMQTVMNEAVSMSQKNFDEAIKVMNQNAKSTLELFHQALQAGPPQQGADSEGRYRDLWESALTTLRRNTETILQANARVTESWAELAKKVSGESEDMMAGPEQNHR